MKDAKEASQAGAEQRARVAVALAQALRTAGYYDAGNAVLRKVCGVLHSLLSGYVEQRSVNVGANSHCLFVEDVRVPTSVSTYRQLSHLVRQFEKWGVDTLNFSAEMSEDELTQALMVLARSDRTGVDDLTEELREHGIERVRVDLRSLESTTGDVGVMPVVAYAAALQLNADMRETAGSDEPGIVRRVRHVTQEVVDQILRDPGALLALSTIKEFDSYLIFHSTNVAVLSVVLGKRLGLSKSRLGELCLAAFLHDTGKLEVDPDVLHKPGSLNRDEWEEMRRHPVLAARALLGYKRLTASNMTAVVVAFEHHLNCDLSGYPPTEMKKTVTLFGNIVAIADRYDALTTPRVYRKVNLTPPEALGCLLESAGTEIDSTLVKLFVEMMGLYPPGTVVKLSGGEVCVVYEPPEVGSPRDRPKVRVLYGGEPGAVINLDERIDGAFARTIVGVLNLSNKGQLPAADPSVLASVE